MNKPINYPLAKLLKEKGFKEQVNNYFANNGKEEVFQPKYTGNYNSHVMVGLLTSRPNLIDVVMWIYEKHGIWINPTMIFSKQFFGYIQTNWNYKTDRQQLDALKFMKKQFNSPTEAYLAAIEYILNNLI